MLAQMVDPEYIAQMITDPTNSTPAASGTKIGGLNTKT